MSQPDPEVVTVGGRRVSLERLTYATVVLMSTLAVYDGWQELTTFAGTALVIIAPILALAVAHFFAEVMQAHAEYQRALTGAEWRAHAASQVQLLLAAAPSLVVLGIGWVSPLDARSTITLLLWTSVVTLVGLSALAGRRAGFRGWRWVVAAVSGGVVGLLVISLQVLLKPH